MGIAAAQHFAMMATMTYEKAHIAHDGAAAISPDAPAKGAEALMAMSGGVDSSVATLLLLKSGFKVIGATMMLYDRSRFAPDDQSTHCSADDIEDAKAVCRRLGLEHKVLDLRDLFSQMVISRFCSAYAEGCTPNPCIDCNRFLKFAALQSVMREQGADYVATGHYARRRFDEKTGQWELLRARDKSKDQSYVLYNITQDQLAHALFPLGDLTKSEVRAIARDNGFQNAEKPESQDICFIPNGSYADFIEDHLPACEALHAFEPGAIVDRGGKRIGSHNGLIRYTIGQRKGIGVAAAEPLYVFAKDVERNELVVGTADDVLVNGVVAHDINLVKPGCLSVPRDVQVKTHYRQEPSYAHVEQTGEDELTIAFAAPRRAAAPGQAAVIYDGDIVLGGGTISNCF